MFSCFIVIVRSCSFHEASQKVGNSRSQALPFGPSALRQAQGQGRLRDRGRLRGRDRDSEPVELPGMTVR
ncbi:hypothetical protein QUF80_05280 [Desulfococcaceae bacterium HSG8]|nr:hypothetical protein [Desulfococcaceae bacterium HSG8]